MIVPILHLRLRCLAITVFLLRSLVSGQGPTKEQAGSLRGSTALSQILVFDAGSSGTRIHVFNMRMSPGAAVPTIDLAVREKQMLKVKPGLSHFAKTEDLAGCQKNIEELLAFADQFVAPEDRPRTPALLKATAGLRAVGEAKAELVLNRVRETFRASPYKFMDDWAAVIKGKEEAGLAWVAANYLRGTFSSSAAEGSTSLGVIEMGGGSTQVTFQIAESDTNRVAEIDRFFFQTALGTKYNLYAHSYLNFGQDYAQSKARDVMLDLEDPCYPQGYMRKDSTGAIVKGVGDSPRCRDHIRNRVLIEGTAPGRYSSELPIRGPFVATENFFYVRSDLKMPNIGKLDASGADERAACERSLTLSKEDAQKMQLGAADAGKPNHCFGLSYQLELLHALKAFSVPGVEVEVKRQINGGDIDWALGAALVHYMEDLVASNGSGDLGGGLGTMPFLLAMLAALLMLLAAARFIMGRNRKAFGSPKDSDTEHPTRMGKY